MKRWIVGGAFLLSASLMTTTPAHAINCVAYVTTVTDFHIMGDAWRWWDAAAEKSYGRGFAPSEGAVMVFDRTAQMHVGHVAIVRAILSPREILIDHANWHRGRVDKSVSVIDVSENNDWSSVKVQWTPTFWGGAFPISGFIYPKDSPRSGDRVEFDRARTHPWGGQPAHVVQAVAHGTAKPHVTHAVAKHTAHRDAPVRCDAAAAGRAAAGLTPAKKAKLQQVAQN